MEVREPSAKYLIRPGYKQTDVGVVPQDWGSSTIQELLDQRALVGHIDGNHGELYPRSDEFKESGVPYITANDLRGYRVSFDSCKFLSPERAHRFQKGVARDGDVLFAHNATVGPTAMLSTELDYVILSTTATYFRCNPEKLLNSYLLYALQSAHFVGQCRAVMAQSTRNQVPITAQRKLSVFLPSTKAEQEAIAAALSDADVLIESLEQLLAKKRHVKQGAMQELLTGKMRLPGFTGECGAKALGALFEFSGGYSASRDQLGTSGHCYLHYGDIHLSTKTYIDVQSESADIPRLDIPLKRVSAASMLDDGDVVFVDASEDDEGTSKHVVIRNPDDVPFIAGLHTIVAKCKATVLAHEYRRHCFQTAAVKAQFRFFAVGTKVSGISKTNIAKITLPVPSVPEQSAIATILSDMDAELAALEAKLTKARQIKQAMMQALLTGRIRLV